MIFMSRRRALLLTPQPTVDPAYVSVCVVFFYNSDVTPNLYSMNTMYQWIEQYAKATYPKCSIFFERFDTKQMTLEKYREVISWAFQHDYCFMYYCVHGKFVDNEFVIELNPTNLVQGDTFWEIFKASNCMLHLWLSTCHGGAFLKCINFDENNKFDMKVYTVCSEEDKNFVLIQNNISRDLPVEILRERGINPFLQPFMIDNNDLALVSSELRIKINEISQFI